MFFLKHGVYVSRCVGTMVSLTTQNATWRR